MIFPIKNEQETLMEMMAELRAKTGITNFNPGATARSLLEVFNNKINGFYKYFDVYAAMLFVSTSEGPYLDMIGATLNCKREGNETDENYRYRICNQVFTAANANRTAIRLRCLAVAGVKDVILTKYSRGSGSFTVHVLTDEIDTPESVLTEVKAAIEEVAAEGVRAIVTKPRVVPLDFTFGITLKGKSQATTSIAAQVKRDIQDYLDGLELGAPILINKIISIASLNENVNQLFLSGMKVSNSTIIIRDKYELEWDERAYVRDITLNIIG